MYLRSNCRHALAVEPRVRLPLDFKAIDNMCARYVARRQTACSEILLHGLASDMLNHNCRGNPPLFSPQGRVSVLLAVKACKSNTNAEDRGK